MVRKIEVKGLLSCKTDSAILPVFFVTASQFFGPIDLFDRGQLQLGQIQPILRLPVPGKRNTSIQFLDRCIILGIFTWPWLTD